MAPNAAERVFAIPELAEAILLDDGIDLQTLLLSQRVNRSFAATIAGSTFLQRRLFLAPNQPTTRTQRRKNKNKKPPYHLHGNPLLINRLLTTPEGYQFHVGTEPIRVGRTPKHCIYFIFRGTKSPTPDKPATGSWRQMHTFRPHVIMRVSCVRADVEGEYRGQGKVAVYRHSVAVDLENPTLGEVLDLAMSVKSTYFTNTFVQSNLCPSGSLE